VGGKATKAVCCAAPRRLCVAWAIMRRERGLRKDALFLSYFISPFVKRPLIESGYYHASNDRSYPQKRQPGKMSLFAH
jgi:hypothetical protein